MTRTVRVADTTQARALFAAVLCLSAFLACERDKLEQERAEAGRVSRAVDLLRRAPNADKGQKLQALRATGCTFPRVCEFRHACVQAYESYVTAIDGAQAARRALAQDAGPTEDAARLVLQSEKRLKQSHELQRKCLAVQGALREELKL